jgi:3-phytase
MFRVSALPGVIAAASLALAGVATPAHAAEPAHPSTVRTASLETTNNVYADLTVATVDTGLTSSSDGATLAKLDSDKSERAAQLTKAVAEQQPDVLVLTGIDVDSDGATLDALKKNYLAKNDDVPDYRYTYAPATNAGVDSGADLDGDGTIGGAGDALGPGDFAGQSSIAVLSTKPIDTNGVRSFTDLAWKDVPGQHLAASSFARDVRSDVPLFSTSLWDLPIDIGNDTVHVVATSLSGATGTHADPVRNADQLAFLKSYVDGATDLGNVEDDQGRSGPLSPDTPSVIAGDLGVDAASGGRAGRTLTSLLNDPSNDAQAPTPTSSAWLATLGRLLQRGSHATQAQTGQGAAQLDYVMAPGDSPKATATTAVDAISEPDLTTRLVVSAFKL